MRYTIRPMAEAEYPLLEEFLYEAIFVPEGETPPPRSITEAPELQVYIQDFGRARHDRALVAEADGEVVGAAWARIMHDYGHIDEETPSLAIAVRTPWRGQGIGTALLEALLTLLRDRGYARASLSVQKANAAVRLCRRAGFDVWRENGEEHIMVLRLRA